MKNSKTFSMELHEMAINAQARDETLVEIQKKAKQHEETLENILKNPVTEAVMEAFFDCRCRYLADIGNELTMFFVDPLGKQIWEPYFASVPANVMRYAKKRGIKYRFIPGKKDSFDSVELNWS